MFGIGPELAKHWNSQGMAARAGNTEQEIRRFEGTHKVSLPSDMRNYLLFVNGMDTTSIRDYQDSNGFSFWPLSKIKNAAEEVRVHSEAYLNFPDRDAFYLFADYLDWCWAYAVLLGKVVTEDSPVFILGKSESPIKIANSFRGFVELYLIDSPTLCDPPKQSIDGQQGLFR
jgi:hypothetical protein